MLGQSMNSLLLWSVVLEGTDSHKNMFLLKEQIERAQSKLMSNRFPQGWLHLSVLATWKKVTEEESPQYPQKVIMWPLKLQWFALLLGEKDRLWTRVLWAGTQIVPRDCLFQPPIPENTWSNDSFRQAVWACETTPGTEMDMMMGPGNRVGSSCVSANLGLW